MASFSLARGLRVLTLIAGAATAVLIVFLMLEWFKLAPPPTAPTPPAAVSAPAPAPPAPAADYTLVVTSALVRGKGTLTFRVRPAAGRELNRELPSELILTPPPAVSVGATRYRSGDFSALRTDEFAVSVPVTQKAAAELPYVFSFSTCETENGRIASCVLHKHTATQPLPAP